jgi:hypothetical protein
MIKNNGINAIIINRSNITINTAELINIITIITSNGNNSNSMIIVIISNLLSVGLENKLHYVTARQREKC